MSIWVWLLGCAARRVPAVDSVPQTCQERFPAELGVDAPFERNQPTAHPLWGASRLAQERARCEEADGLGCSEPISQAAALCVATIALPELDPSHADLRFWSASGEMVWVISELAPAHQHVVLLRADTGRVSEVVSLRSL